jgi:hypothetical protein
MRDLPGAPTFHLFQRMLVKRRIKNFVEYPRIVFRTRWLDVVETGGTASGQPGGGKGAPSAR